MPPKQATLSKFFQPSVGKAGNQKKDAEPTALPDHAGIDNLSDLVSTQSTRDALTTALHNHFGEDQRDREQESAKLCDSANIANYTPLEKQVVQIKKTHPDCLLMIECGYRTRFFGEDAKNASKVLGIHARHDHSFLVASVPTYRSLFHCRRLIKAGHKVAMIRQQETAAIRKTKGTPSKSTFDRVVAGIFSAGEQVW